MPWAAIAFALVIAIASGCGYEKTAAPASTTTTDVRALARQVTVYKVARDIPKALSGREVIDQGYVTAATIAAEFDPVTSVKDIEQIRDKYAVANFAAGQIVVIGMFVPLGAMCDPTFGSCLSS